MGSCIINNDDCRWKEVPSARVLMARKCVWVGSGVFHKLRGPHGVSTCAYGSVLYCVPCHEMGASKGEMEQLLGPSGGHSGGGKVTYLGSNLSGP